MLFCEAVTDSALACLWLPTPCFRQLTACFRTMLAGSTDLALSYVPLPGSISEEASVIVWPISMGVVCTFHYYKPQGTAVCAFGKRS